MPTVSVVTPAFNASQHLAETIDSVLAQTFSDFDLVVVDDGSTDDTMALAQRFAVRDKRVRIVSTSNGGPAAARNLALQAARGRFVALLDSDDLIYPQYLANQIEILKANPDVSIVTANAVNRGGSAKFDGKPYWPQTTGIKRLSSRDVIGQEEAVCILSVLKRDVFETIGGFNPVFPLAEDYEFWIRATLAGFVILRNYETLGVYRRHQGSLSSNEPRMIQGVLNVLHHTESRVRELPDERDLLHRQIARLSQELPRAELRASLQRGDATGASRALRRVAIDRGSWMLSACASLTSCWPQPLLWAYRLRRSVPERSRAPARSAA